MIFYDIILFFVSDAVYLRTRDGNEYPVNRVLARTSHYRIPKSVFGYLENFFYENNDKIFRTINN